MSLIRPVKASALRPASRAALLFASACRAAPARSRGAAQNGALPVLGLSPEAAQGLADLLPVLICGEASAEFVFDEAGRELPASLPSELREALLATAADERRHGEMLNTLRDELPPPRTRDAGRDAAEFLRGLASGRLGVHLSRIAALDAGVCIVLAAACARGAAVSGCRRTLNIFRQIRSDEGRHVRISRRCARALGVSRTEALAEQRRVFAGFAALLSTQADALAAIGVDFGELERRFDADDSNPTRLARAMA